MSHYCRIKTKIVEKEALIKTLADIGYPSVEDHEKPANLYGYQGDPRSERANIVIRRKNISPASNDIGFRKTKSGNYEAVVSEYDLQLLGADWVDKVSQRYAYNNVVSKLAEQGFEIDEEVFDKKTKQVHLKLKRSC